MASAIEGRHHEDDSETKSKIGFFDLPREIRDAIYEYSVISIRDTSWKGHSTDICTMDWSALCHCQQDTLAVIRPTPPYFAHHKDSCLVPDRFLYSISLASKQFAAELRPYFFRNTAFNLDTNSINREVLRETFGGPLLEKWSDFIEALGPEAKELRRFMMAVSTSRSLGSAGTMMLGVGRTGEWNVEPSEEGRPLEGDPEPRDAEDELKPFRSMLHPDVNVMVAVIADRVHDRDIRFFECTVSDNDEACFVAREIDSVDDWVD